MYVYCRSMVDQLSKASFACINRCKEDRVQAWWSETHMYTNVHVHVYVLIGMHNCNVHVHANQYVQLPVFLSRAVQEQIHVQVHIQVQVQSS